MQQRLLLCLICFITIKAQAQQFCDPNGNVIIYSNYDGGYLNINVDQNIPNLKIGITTYEDCEITISGTYASNITEVIYAGYKGDNQHCNPSPLDCAVNGVSSSIVSLLQYPPVTWTNPYGWNYGILCNYSCDSANYQGGCNTPDQIVHYYLTEFGGALYYHYTQYGCWVGTYNVSNGGNCCIGENIIPPQFSINAAFTASDDTICIKEAVFFTNNSSNTYPGPTQYDWDFGDGTGATTEDAQHGYINEGNYIVTLTVTDSTGVAFDTQTMVITVIDCLPTGIDQAGEKNFLVAYPNPADDVVEIVSSLKMTGDIDLTDAAGRIMMKLPVSSAEKISLDIGSLPAGVYCLRYEGNDFSINKKLIIE